MKTIKSKCLFIKLKLVHSNLYIFAQTLC